MIMTATAPSLVKSCINKTCKRKKLWQQVTFVLVTIYSCCFVIVKITFVICHSIKQIIFFVIVTSDFCYLQVVRFDGGEYVSRAGEFNDLKTIKKEQWDVLEQMVRKAKSE